MKKILLSIITLGALNLGANAQSIKYVNHAATGSSTGTSWANAFTNAEEALSAAQNGDEIWVAQGTYVRSTTSRFSSFTIDKDSISLYGGFDGTETSLSQRDIKNNVTVLSGDYNNTPGIISDDAYTVLMIWPASGTTINYAKVDGLTITNGNADRSNAGSGRYGGGVYLGGFVEYVDIKNCVISNNQAHGGAGLSTFGIIDNDYTINIENCHFTGNKARWRVAFEIFVSEGLTVEANFVNCLITNNECTYINGSNGFTGSGGGFTVVEASNLTANIINTTITQNIESGSSPVLEQGIVTLNKHTVGPVNVGSLDVNIDNTIIWGNEIATSFSKSSSNYNPDNLNISNTITEDTITASANVTLNNYTNTDPLFTNTTNDFTLQSNSTAIDAGSQVGLTIPALDLAGNPRISGDEIDLGCYETLIITGFNEQTTNANLSVYPNPVSEFLTLEGDFANENVEVRVINNAGVQVLTRRFENPSANTLELSISNLKSGQYLVVINTNNKQTVQRININH